MSAGAALAVSAVVGAGYPAAMLHRFEDLWLAVPPGVFRPRSDAHMFSEVLRARPELPGAAVLDLCTGSGVLALVAAERARRVVAVDLTRRAAAAARLNAILNRRRLYVRRGDLFDPVAGERFDVIVSNPPYLPTPPGHVDGTLGAEAWDGGPDGRRLVDRICDGAPRHLRPGGTLLLLQSSLTDVDRTVDRLRRAGLADVGPVASWEGALGPLARARAAYLRERGVLGGELREEIVVLGARLEIGVPVRGRERREHAGA